MKKWEIIAALSGGLILIGGLIGAIFVASKEFEKADDSEEILYTM